MEKNLNIYTINEFYHNRWNSGNSLLSEENITKSRELYLYSINKQISKIKNFDQDRFINCLYQSFLDNINEDKINDEFTYSIQYFEAIKIDTYCMLRYLKMMGDYSIIYTGRAHSKTYLKFIKYYFDVEPLIERID